MIDFLRANTFVSKEEYMWKWTIPQITLSSIDFTRVEYKKEKKDKKEVEHKVDKSKVAQPKNAEEFLDLMNWKK